MSSITTASDELTTEHGKIASPGIPGHGRPLQFPKSSGRSMTALTGFEIFFAALALSLWFLLFCGGSLLGTSVYRAQLASSLAWSSKIKPLVFCIAFWTTSNVGLLSCLSAFLGAVGYRCRFTIALDPNCSVQPPTDAIRSILLTSYFAAVMRGFGVYTLSTAGLILVATDSVTEPAQETYLRLAPLISIVGFYSGFNPQTFGGLLSRVQTILRTDKQKSSAEAPATAAKSPPATVPDEK